MNENSEVTIRDNTLPDTIEDLHNYTLVGEEAVKACQAKINAIKKISDSEKAHKELLVDGQRVGKLVLNAEIKKGELLAYRKNQVGFSKKNSTGGSKSTLPKDISKKQSHQAQEIARNPEIVKEVIKEADVKGEIATKKEVLKRVKEKKKDDKRTKRETKLKKQRETRKERAIIYKQDTNEFLTDIADGTVDLLITDPPYSTDIDDIEMFVNTWVELALTRLTKLGKAYIFIGAYQHELQAYLNEIGIKKSPGLYVDSHNCQVLVWTYRNTIGPCSKHLYKQNWQAILYINNYHSPLDCPNLNEQFSVFDINAPDGRHEGRYHAWEKPYKLAEMLIRHSTKEGDVVIDPFAGTGTFLLAAADLGRKATGCDNNKDMIDIAVKRGCVFGE
jgi:site-specific DNA-methyltransferase (adenine-specific)|tara:strand:+ start:462 stop:1628 length:1167 start_codon:yes stop_codon:yes gene_type:complete